MENKNELRTAIAPHHTKVVDEEWKGAEMVARLKLDQDADYYKKMFAWFDPDGNPSAKTSYKFPHHQVDTDGNIGEANLRGCIAGIAVLNGGRGGADIPDSDRKGVYSHLSTHLKDADYTPPELKSDNNDIERRAFISEIIVAHRDNNEQRKIVGHAAVFNKPSLFMGFREKIMPGAFAKTILEDDIRALFNHNPDYVLGRNKAGTLKLEEDEIGLRIEIDPPETSFANDLMESIRRGDIDQMSFGFMVRDEKWSEENGEIMRTLLDVKLYDVSPVVFPAYPDTDVAVRSILSDVGIDFERLVRAIKNPAQESRYIEEVISVLRGILPVQANRKISLLRKKLDLLEKL